MNANTRCWLWCGALLVAPYLVFQYAVARNADVLLTLVAMSAPVFGLYLLAKSVDPIAANYRSER